MFAARRDHWLGVIQPALERGETVLCDRFTDATFAYQGGGRRLDWQALLELERLTFSSRPSGGRPSWRPDLTLWFDLPPEQAAERRAAARAPDRFERQDSAFFARVRDGYAQRMKQAPQRFVRLDASAERGQVWTQIQLALEQRPWW